MPLYPNFTVLSISHSGNSSIPLCSFFLAAGEVILLGDGSYFKSEELEVIEDLPLDLLGPVTL